MGHWGLPDGSATTRSSQRRYNFTVKHLLATPNTQQQKVWYRVDSRESSLYINLPYNALGRSQDHMHKYYITIICSSIKYQDPSFKVADAA